MRTCYACGQPLRRWQRACNRHGWYTVVNTFEWEDRLVYAWETSSVRSIWKRAVYGKKYHA